MTLLMSGIGGTLQMLGQCSRVVCRAAASTPVVLLGGGAAWWQRYEQLARMRAISSKLASRYSHLLLCRSSRVSEGDLAGLSY